jgi:hypothetical protein
VTTLFDLLFTDTASLHEQLLPRLADLDKAFAVAGPGFSGEVLTGLATVLNADVTALVGQAWETDREVADACSTTKDHPQATAVIVAAQHTFRSEQHPQIEVRTDGVVTSTIDVTVEVELTFDAARITVRHGQIAEIDAGSASSEATLAVGRLPPIRRKLKNVEISHRKMRFGQAEDASVAR